MNKVDSTLTIYAHRPLIGGSLSRPATKYPTYFDYTFLKRFPYFLPCFLVSLFSVVGFLLAFFFLQDVGVITIFIHLSCIFLIYRRLSINKPARPLKVAKHMVHRACPSDRH